MHDCLNSSKIGWRSLPRLSWKQLFGPILPVDRCDVFNCPAFKDPEGVYLRSIFQDSIEFDGKIWKFP